MTVAQTSTRRLLIPAAAGTVVIAAVVVALWLLAAFAGSHPRSAGHGRQVQATVLRSASCQGQDPNDTVSVHLAGHDQQAKLDGCGYRTGQQLAVVAPMTLDAGGTVELASTTIGNSAGLSHRVAFLLLLVSTAAGGACGYFVHRGRGGATLATVLAAPVLSAGGSTAAELPPSEPAPETSQDPREITAPGVGKNWFADSDNDPDHQRPAADTS